MINIVKVLIILASSTFIKANNYSPVSLVGLGDLPCIFHRNYMYYDLQYLMTDTGINIDNIGENGKYNLVVNFCQSIRYPPVTCPFELSLGFLINNETGECFTLSKEREATTEVNHGGLMNLLTLWEYPRDGSHIYNEDYIRVKGFNTNKNLKYSLEYHIFCDRFKEDRHAFVNEEKGVVTVTKHGAAGCSSFLDGFMLWIFAFKYLIVSIHVLISLYLMFGNWKDPKRIIMLTGWLSFCNIIFFVACMLMDYRRFIVSTIFGLFICCFAALLLTWQLEKKVNGGSMYVSGVFLTPLLSHNIENIIMFFFRYYTPDWVTLVINVVVGLVI